VDTQVENGNHFVLKIVPSSNDVTPKDRDVTPKTSNITPEFRNVTLKTSNVTPKTSSVTPEVRNVTLVTNNITTVASDVSQKITTGAEEVKPKHVDVTPDTSDVTRLIKLEITPFLVAKNLRNVSPVDLSPNFRPILSNNSIQKVQQLYSNHRHKKGFVIRGRFVEQNLMLSSSFKCYQIHNHHRYYFGHTLLCYLSHTLFNEPTSEAGLLNMNVQLK
jgi:hypothetical protein